ncbi:MAG: ATP-grasp domain-containing protein, partial [Candidatus Promineifilaceae bacterium]
MPESQPKQIGLLIGREWSWPSAFIAEVNQRGLDVTADFVKIGETRVDSPCPHDVIIDRMSHDIPYYRLYLKYAALNGCYVINNPFVMAADDKFFGLALARRLGLQVPRTAVLPNKRVEGENVPESFRNLVYPMDWQSIIDYVGVPAILKDVHTGGRRVAHRVGSVDELIRWYDESDTLSLVLQTIAEADQHVHCFVIGRQQVMLAAYSQADKRYQPGPPELDETTARQLKIAARELSE